MTAVLKQKEPSQEGSLLNCGVSLEMEGILSSVVGKHDRHRSGAEIIDALCAPLTEHVPPTSTNRRNLKILLGRFVILKIIKFEIAVV